MAGDEPVARRHGFRGVEGGGGARDRAGVRGAVDAAGAAGDNTYANYSEANRALSRLTVLPLADKILGGIAQALRSWWPELALTIDLDAVPALAADRERLWAQLSAADFLSEPEKRAMLGFPENKP